IADHSAARLDDRFRNAVAEMLAQRAGDRLAIAGHARNLLQITGREAAAEIDHRQVDAALGERTGDLTRRLQRAVPHFRIALLRADRDRDAVGNEAETVGVIEKTARHVRQAADLARERPSAARAAAQDAREDLRAGRGPGAILDSLDAIDR